MWRIRISVRRVLVGMFGAELTKTRKLVPKRKYLMRLARNPSILTDLSLSLPCESDLFFSSFPRDLSWMIEF